jgi:hypothetical protein
MDGAIRLQEMEAALASKPRPKASDRAKPKPPREPAPPAPAPAAIGLDLASALRIARELRSWADKALSVAEGAAEMSVAAARSITSDPKKKAAATKTGDFLRASREAAGITTEQLGAAIDLADPAILHEAEAGGATALSFDTILRLAGVLGRNDPFAFALNLTRTHNPDMWRTLDQFGIGKLVVQAGREREFANLYRANDAARHMSDEEFANVLKFVGAAFDMAVGFHAAAETRTHGQ